MITKIEMKDGTKNFLMKNFCTTRKIFFKKIQKSFNFIALLLIMLLSF